MCPSEGIWISPAILSLKQKTMVKVLLAIICQRAAASGGYCHDTNRELAEPMGIHLKSISEMITALDEAGLVRAIVDKSNANRRTLTPIRKILQAYEPKPHSLTEGIQELADRPVKPDRKAAKAKANIPIDEPPTRPLPIPPVAPVFPHPSLVSEFDEEGRKRRWCPLTGVEVTNQRPDSVLLNRKTLQRWARRGDNAFQVLLECLYEQYLTPKDVRLHENFRRHKDDLLLERIREYWAKLHGKKY